MTIHKILVRWLPLLHLVQHCLAVIDNRKPDANYVIPISDQQKAEVYCVSDFAKTIFQKVTGPSEEDVVRLDCQKCSLDHVRYKCCRVVKWDDIKSPLTLRCTSVGMESGVGDGRNVPFIHVSVVRKKSQIGSTVSEKNKTVRADSSVQYFCHEKSNVTRLTAGSHIGLGWVQQSRDSDDPKAATTPSPGSSYTAEAKQYDQVMSDNTQNKEAQYSQLYSNKNFKKLWISEDIKVELMEHNNKFTCNETEYWLERGSRCLTPSKRALLIMTNCNLVEKIFIVVGVIVLLIISYIVFNLMVWLWKFVWHKSRKHDDDLAVLM